MVFAKLNSRLLKMALIAAFIALFCADILAVNEDLTAVNLRVEYKIDPVIDVQNPRLSWELNSSVRGQMQTAYQIMVASSAEKLAKGKADIWDSNKTLGSATNQIKFGGKALTSRAICYWKVRSWDKNGKAGAWSAAAKWEMGLLNKTDWTAEWIGNDLTKLGKGKVYHLPPAPFFRTEKSLKSDIKNARLYVTALGLYEFNINGQRIGNDCFTPGWTDYNKRVYYQTYDITKAVKQGKNAFGAVVADGWYAGYLGYALLIGNPVVKNFYGKTPLLKAQIEIEYANGEKETIATNDSWKTNHGPILEADILNGETYDANLIFNGWQSTSYDDSKWQKSQIFPDKTDRKIQAYSGNQIKVFSELKAKTVTARAGGKYIFDLGQNFAGVVRLKVKGRKGDTISLKYGEVLFPNGDIMTENLRKARATDTYILNGNREGEEWTPKFTYHGFQFVEATGFRSKPDVDAITGIVLSSSTPEIGAFETDNEMINQLYRNIVWTQRSNYFDVPTDCPQRDERMGWTGDAQAYIQSATFNNDISAFFTKWLVDLNDAQRADNTYPLYAPAPSLRVTDTYSPGWSEAGIICPYTIYKTYGDTKVIQEFWANMSAYMQFLETKSKGEYLYKEASFEEINPKGGFGDWLSVGKKTPPDMLATMYYAYTASMMSEMATAIGKHDESKRFDSIFNKIKQAFIQHYADEQGRFKTNAAAYGNGEGYVDGEMGFDGHTQTAYANAIYMQLLSPDFRQKAGQSLVELIKTNGGKLSTGFLGVRPLLPALSATGHTDEAYKLLLSTEYPSWGFEVLNGANTIWERWNSYIKGKGFENNAGMNSFNHYAFGSVNEWLFGNAAGIQMTGIAYKTFNIKPEIAKEGISAVKATYHSINGAIKSAWKKEGNQLVLDIVVPVNTRADVFVPCKNKEGVKEGNTLVSTNKDLVVKDLKDGCLQISVGSGTYRFTTSL
jgi:alpha-L-rhamnosidase